MHGAPVKAANPMERESMAATLERAKEEGRRAHVKMTRPPFVAGIILANLGVFKVFGVISMKAPLMWTAPFGFTLSWLSMLRKSSKPHSLIRHQLPSYPTSSLLMRINEEAHHNPPPPSYPPT